MSARLKPAAIVLGAMVYCGVAAATVAPPSAVTTTAVAAPANGAQNAFYPGNQAPLAPSALIKLPVGAIAPEGWLRRYLELQRDGMTGNLGHISKWLQKTDNAWLTPNGQGKWGWEEVPYWLRGFGDLGYILGDKAMIEEARLWLEGAIASQRPDGDFGPMHRDQNGARDFWPNMVMLNALQSYYDYSQDRRVLALMTRYFHYQASLADADLLNGYWQRARGGDNLYSVLWLYNHTGDTALLDLARKLHRVTLDWSSPGQYPDAHNVNIAQGFREPATYFLVSRDQRNLAASYRNFFTVRERFGQVPGGMFGGDEKTRAGHEDPQQAVETCGIVEQLFSDEMMLWITGDTFWADHAEDVAFNTAPAAYMPDFRALRYLTAPNMVASDRRNHAPGIYNEGPFFLMNPLSHRCCQHNHSFGWPYYSQNLWMATPDNGIAAVLYAASTARVKVGNGTEITLHADTRYPFEEQVRIALRTPAAVVFPLYLRIPAWAAHAQITLNGAPLSTPAAAGQYVRIERQWHDGDALTLQLPMQVAVRQWPMNHNSVSVNYGPLTFSLHIRERRIALDPRTTAVADSQWRDDLDTAQWPAVELQPASPWNYGLLLQPVPENSFTVMRRDWPADDFPFTAEAAPIVISAPAKRIPGWRIDNNGLVGALRDSPVKSTQPRETVELIPMGAARLRISAFPVIGEDAAAQTW